MFLMIILYLNSEQCSGQSMDDERHDAGYSCENCIVGSRRGRILCRNCVSGNSDSQFTCGRCKIGTESGTFNCRGCSNKDPVFGENMQIIQHRFLIHGRSLKCQIQVFMSLNILEYLLLFVGSTTTSTVQPATAETGKAL